MSVFIFFPSTLNVFTVTTFPPLSYSLNTIQLPTDDFAFAHLPIEQAIEFFPDVAAWLEFPDVAAWLEFPDVAAGL